MAQYAMIIAGAMKVLGAASGAQQQSNELGAKAKIAFAQAQNVWSAYNQREEQQRREARLQAGERRAAIAQSGTGFGGSNADVYRQSEVMAELDALNIRYAGLTQRAEYINEGRAYKRAIKGVWRSALLNIGSQAMQAYGGMAGGGGGSAGGGSGGFSWAGGSSGGSAGMA